MCINVALRCWFPGFRVAAIIGNRRQPGNSAAILLMKLNNWVAHLTNRVKNPWKPLLFKTGSIWACSYGHHPSPADYSTGVLNTMSSSVFPRYNGTGPYLALANQMKLRKHCCPSPPGSCSSTKTLWEIHHAANAQVALYTLLISVLNWSFSTGSFLSIPCNYDPEPRFAGLDIVSRQDVWWENIQLFSVTSKFVSKLFKKLVYT